MSAVVGQTLRAVVGVLFGTQPLTTTWQWTRRVPPSTDDDPIAGATGEDYTTVDADAGAEVGVIQTTSNAFPPAATRASEQRVTVVGAAPSIDADPTVLGTPAVGQTLTATLASVSGTPPITDAVQWLRDGSPIAGQTSLTYEVVMGDVGTTIVARQSATSAWGSDTRDSAGVVIDGVPVNLTAPVASGGDPFVGNTLSVTDGTWTNAPTGFAYQWTRDGSPIGSATASTYLLVTADEGALIRCEVTASNSAGDSAPEPSNALGPIFTVPSSVTAPVIAGDATQGETLTVTSTGTWTYSPSSFDYQWTRDGSPIGSATSDSYLLDAADVGALIRCEVTAINAAGSSTPEPSNALGPVASAGEAPVITVAPVLGSGLRVGDLIDVTAATVTGDPAPTVVYTLRRNGTPVAGLTDVDFATLAAHQYVDADEGVDLTVRADASNGVLPDADAVSNTVTIRALAPVDVTGLAGYAFSRASAATDGLPAAALPADDVDSYATNALRDVAAKIAAGDPARYLCEQAGTNWWSRSNDLTVAPWTVANTVTRTGGQTDPAGGTSACRIECPAPGTLNSLQTGAEPLAGDGGVPMAIGAWVREAAAPGNWCFLTQNPNVALGGAAPTNWTRYVIQKTSTSSNQASFILINNNQTGNGGIAAGARDAIIAFPQAERSRWASSYIVTSGAVASRAPDDLAAQLPEILCRGVSEHHLVMPQSSAAFLAAGDDAVIVTDGADIDLRLAISGTDIIVSMTTDAGTYTSGPITWSAGDRVRIVVDWVLGEYAVYVGPASSLTGTFQYDVGIAGEWAPSTACDLLHDAGADHITGRGGWLA